MTREQMLQEILLQSVVNLTNLLDIKFHESFEDFLCDEGVTCEEFCSKLLAEGDEGYSYCSLIAISVRLNKRYELALQALKDAPAFPETEALMKMLAEF